MSIAENIARLNEQISQAARAAGRNPDEIELMAVSKVHPPEAIVEAYEAGQRLFGENKVQEFQAKRDQVMAAMNAIPGVVCPRVNWKVEEVQA